MAVFLNRFLTAEYVQIAGENRIRHYFPVLHNLCDLCFAMAPSYQARFLSFFGEYFLLE
jgi:hypothetical protein